MEKIGLKKGEILICKETSIWKIFEVLVNSKESLNIKGIKTQANLDYAYCHKRTKLLQRLNFVRVAEKREGPKGRKLNFYDLTVKGLVYYLVFSKFQSLDKIIEKYKELLPHVFGEWRYFQTKDVEDILKKYFQQASNEIVWQAQTNGFYQKQVSSEQLQEWLQVNTLLPWLTYVRLGFWPSKKSGQFSEKFQNAIRENNKVWAYVKPIIIESAKQTKELLEQLNKVLA